MRHGSFLPVGACKLYFLPAGEGTYEEVQKKERFYRDLNPDYKDQNLGC